MLSKEFFAVFPQMPQVFDRFLVDRLIDQPIAGTSLVRNPRPNVACQQLNAVSTRY
jgi:hypothetical protein